MRIKSVQACSVDFPPVNRAPAQPRRPAWAENAEVANPMSKFPRFKRYRSSWLPPFPAVWVKVTAEDGSFGIGLTSNGRATASIIDDHLGPLLVDEPCLAIDKCFDMMCRATTPYGTTGIASCAISGIDLALWDLAGKLLDRPVYELLGGPVRDSVFVYATGNDVDWYLESGFRAVKLACPYGPADGLDGLNKNERLVAEARDLCGPDVEIMLDCYMAFDVEYTVRLAERLRSYHLKWIEEFLVPDDLAGYRQVRSRIPWQGLAGGEHLFMPRPFQELIEHGTLDILQPDIYWVGGLTAVRRICQMADNAGVTVILHGGGSNQYGLHATVAMPNMPWGEWFMGSAPGVPIVGGWRHELSQVDSQTFPADGVGFGLGVEESWVRPFSS